MIEVYVKEITDALILIQDNPDVLLCDALSFAERYTVQFALRQVVYEVEN